MNFRINLPLIVLAYSIQMYAQDYIHLKDKSYIKFKITEVGSEIIRFKNYPVSEDGVVFTIEKYKILEIAMEDGTRLTFDNFENQSLVAREYFYGQNTKAVKFDFLAPIYNNMEVRV